jgi:quercetin dioxygenase-like cupin family protein
MDPIARNEGGHLMSTKKHLGRIIGLAIMAALTVSAFAATASAHQWTIGGQTLSVLKGTGTAHAEGVTAELEEGTTAKLKGTLLGKPLF